MITKRRLFFSLYAIVLSATAAYAALPADGLEDYDYVAEHAPESAMNNRMLSLPWPTAHLFKGRKEIIGQAGYSRIDAGLISLRGPLTSAAFNYAYRRRWAVQGMVFYDRGRFSGGGEDELNPLFVNPYPA